MQVIDVGAWTPYLEQELRAPYFAALLQRVGAARAAGTVYPPEERTFFALTATPPERVRAVILGQDPYHEPVTDAWEQRKVSELAEKTYGGGTPSTLNEAYWDGDIPWIQSSDVVDGRLFGVVPRKRITQYGLNNSATQLVPKNSIAIITRVGVGKLAFMPYSYATSQDFLSLSKLNAEPLFTVYACYKKLQSELNAVQGTSIKGITKDELLAKTVMVPQYAEQQQIGAFFSQLDNLITLHQRKHLRLHP